MGRSLSYEMLFGLVCANFLKIIYHLFQYTDKYIVLLSCIEDISSEMGAGYLVISPFGLVVIVNFSLEKLTSFYYSRRALPYLKTVQMTIILSLAAQC